MQRSLFVICSLPSLFLCTMVSREDDVNDDDEDEDGDEDDAIA